jgi:hypothetical protein
VYIGHVPRSYTPHRGTCSELFNKAFNSKVALNISNQKLIPQTNELSEPIIDRNFPVLLPIGNIDLPSYSQVRTTDEETDPMSDMENEYSNISFSLQLENKIESYLERKSGNGNVYFFFVNNFPILNNNIHMYMC